MMIKEKQSYDRDFRQTAVELSLARGKAKEIAEELRAQGRTVSQNRVAKMMRSAGIQARKPRRFIATTDSKHNYPIAPNVLEQISLTDPKELFPSLRLFPSD